MVDFVSIFFFGFVLIVMVIFFNVDGGVDYGVVEKLVDYFIIYGSDGLVVCGIMGEFFIFFWEEEYELFWVVK